MQNFKRLYQNDECPAGIEICVWIFNLLLIMTFQNCGMYQNLNIFFITSIHVIKIVLNHKIGYTKKTFNCNIYTMLEYMLYVMLLC